MQVDRASKELRPAGEECRPHPLGIEGSRRQVRLEQPFRERGLLADPAEKIGIHLDEVREHRHAGGIGNRRAGLIARARESLVAAAAATAAAAASAAAGRAEARLRGFRPGGEDRELPQDPRGAAIGARRILVAADELLEMRLAGHAHVLVDRHLLSLAARLSRLRPWG